MSDDIVASGASAPIPADFVELIRDALAHLYEPAHLVRHPLRALLADALPSLGDPAQSLRLFLLDAVEHMQPQGEARSSEKANRPYLVLVQRYVGGFSVDDIVAKLQIGDRQFRREHQKGLEALAAYVYNLTRASDSAAPGSPSLLSEVESLGVALVSQPLADLLAAATEPAQALARHCGVVLALAPGCGGEPCLCDRTLAKQALLSSLGAVLQRHPRYVTIATLSAPREAHVELRISPAVPAEEQDGLASALAEPKALMQAQGGTLTLVRGERGAGTAVRLSFRPAAAGRVLVVDDNERMLRLYERYLMTGRYSAITAASAEEALAALATSVPDAIVLDVMMRDVDGWEVLQGLRSRPDLAQVPIIVCSVLNEPTLALALGATAYLRKPIAADVLLAALARALGQSSPAAPRPAAP
ncbi:MAG: response regulator [Anaerolineae bacterium]